MNISLKTKQKFFIPKNKNKDDYDKDTGPGRLNTLNVSSYGYHYWDPNVTLKQSDVHWPPIPKITQTNHNTFLDFNKQTNRIKIEEMTFDVNENRFEMIHKNSERLSQYCSPIIFSIKSKEKRICKINKKKCKD